MISSLNARQHTTLAALTLGTVLVHGYHPLAEDGGLYVTGVKAALDPAMFPHDRMFVTATEHYSTFAPLMAAAVHTLHMPLMTCLLLVYVAGIWLLLFAAWRLAKAVGATDRAQELGVSLLSAWITLPVAGTSLLLMDPYVTARTLSTPLCLLALSCAIRGARRAWLECGACLLIAAIFHPLMTLYGAALVLCVLAAKSPRRTAWFAALLATAFITATVLQLTGTTDTPAMAAAAQSRYYWFLAQWQWYELLGLLGPPAVLWLAMQKLPLARTLCLAAIALGAIAVLVALVFAREASTMHAVARLQPLRAFLMIYALMAVLIGVVLADSVGTRPTCLFVLAMAAIMLFVQRETFAGSSHLEWPGRTPANPWTQAFVWARENTVPDALFAIDAKYITSDEEDGQSFRATAERSVLPDFSKDGGQAAIYPTLANTWWNGQRTQQGLNAMSDTQRARRLLPFGVNWIVLRADAATKWNCPYRNAAVKVCSLTAAKD